MIPFERLIANNRGNWISNSTGLLGWSERAAAGDPNRDFLVRMLEAMNIRMAVSAADLARIPVTGRLVVVANHPLGGMEGFVLGALLRSVRPDVRLLANHMLRVVPDLHDYMIFAAPFGREGSAVRDRRSRKESLRWLRAEGALGVFPAGEVSSLDWSRGGGTIPEWSPAVARLVRLAEAPVLPVVIRSSNSLTFRALGLLRRIDERARLLEVRIGEVIPWRRLSEREGDADIISYLQRCTGQLDRRFPVRLSEGRMLALPLPAAQPGWQRSPPPAFAWSGG